MAPQKIDRDENLLTTIGSVRQARKTSKRISFLSIIEFRLDSRVESVSCTVELDRDIFMVVVARVVVDFLSLTC